MTMGGPPGSPWRSSRRRYVTAWRNSFPARGRERIVSRRSNASLSSARSALVLRFMLGNAPFYLAAGLRVGSNPGGGSGFPEKGAYTNVPGGRSRFLAPSSGAIAWRTTRAGILDPALLNIVLWQFDCQLHFQLPLQAG